MDERHMVFSEETITVAKGTRLLKRRWVAENSRAEVVIVHGFAEHCGRYGALVEHLLSHSYSVTAYDQRGHGHSDGLPGHIDRFAIYEDDLDCIVQGVRKTNDAKVLLVGHSMGGLVVMRYLLRYGEYVGAAAVSAPLLGFAVQAPVLKVLIGRIAARAAPRFRMTNEIDPAVLSRDDAVGKAYAADPLVGHMVSPRWFVETGRAMKDMFQSAPQIGCPILVMHGTEDRLASVESTKRVFERIGSADKELVIYQGHYHELFNEPDKNDVYRKVTDWLKPRVTG